MNTSNELLLGIVVMLLAILLLGLLIKRLNQPYFVAYIIAGVILGPHGIELYSKPETISKIGELGLLLQMFFLGTKREIQTVLLNIKKPFAGAMAQLFFSFLFILLFGFANSWNYKEIIVFTFIISLSSSAIILEYLDEKKELSNPLGQLTSGILVVQDFMLVPMLLIINLLGNQTVSSFKIIALIASALLITFFLKRFYSKKEIRISILEHLSNDHEGQVFMGLLLCFGFGWITQQLNLSAAIGALMAGILISESRSMEWLERNLIPFRVFFISLFFLSIGLQLNIDFILQHIWLILLIVGFIIIINSAINAIVFRLLKFSWHDSIYAGALLSQIGEFSLVLCMVARSQELVDSFWYQLTLATITGTMIITALWTNVIRSFIYRALI
jgi:CPA2 family monovalent cation:H+ antiporter-2